MNFIKAIQHATIGYGIRRKVWPSPDHNILSLNDLGELEWVGRQEGRCLILGLDDTYDLQPEDLKATDWETV